MVQGGFYPAWQNGTISSIRPAVLLLSITPALMPNLRKSASNDR